LADAVFDVNDVVAGFEIELVGGEDAGGFVGFGRFGYRVGGFEEIFRTEDGTAAFLKHVAALDVAADERNAGTHRLRALREVFGDLLAAEIDLIRDGIFTEDIGQALDFAGGGCEEGEPDAGFEESPGFADGHLEVAVEGHRRAAGDVEG